GHSPDCREKGGTGSDRSQRLGAILRRSSDIAPRPEAAVLAKADSIVPSHVELPRELWRHSRCATRRPKRRHGREGNQGPPRLLCSVGRAPQSSRMPTILLVPQRRGGLLFRWMEALPLWQFRFLRMVQPRRDFAATSPPNPRPC